MYGFAPSHYQDPNESNPSSCFAAWYVAGPFNGPAPGKGLDAVYAPEKDAAHDSKTTYTDRKATLGWQRLDGQPTVDLAEGVPGGGVAYAFSTLEAGSGWAALSFPGLCGEGSFPRTRIQAAAHPACGSFGTSRPVSLAPV